MRNALNATGRPIWFSITGRLRYDDSQWHASMHCIKVLYAYEYIRIPPAVNS